MHGYLSRQDTPAQDQDGAERRSRLVWPILVLVLGGVLTLGWIGLVVWISSQVVGWALAFGAGI
jgi:hypothetical protein